MNLQNGSSIGDDDKVKSTMMRTLAVGKLEQILFFSSTIQVEEIIKWLILDSSQTII